MTDEEIKDNVRKQITKYRKLSGLKQEELGKLLGLKKTTISSWEVGKSMPDVCTLYKLSQIFNVSISTLYNAQLEINEDKIVRAVEALDRIEKYGRILKALDNEK